MQKPEMIKICGISTPPALEAAIADGASHIGMIFYAKSPRHVSFDIARSLSQLAGDRVLKVAVSVDADDAYLDQIVKSANPDLLQLHGQESVERVNEVKQRFGLPVIKSFAVESPDDLQNAKKYIGTADLFLFDAKPPAGSDLPGGNGVAFDWEIMDQWADDVPYMLSGGLDAENVIEALSRSNAPGVDVSSGVESSPGKKDTALIHEFLARLA